MFSVSEYESGIHDDGALGGGAFVLLVSEFGSGTLEGAALGGGGAFVL